MVGAMVLFSLPHVAALMRENSTNDRRLKFSEYHPLIQEALNVHVREASPVIFKYLTNHRVPIVFAPVSSERNSQRVVSWRGSRIEISPDYCRESQVSDPVKRASTVAKIARYLLHEGTHCLRLDAATVVGMVVQEHRYTFGMYREEKAAYQSESPLGFGVVHLTDQDVEAERGELVTGLLARDAMGFLLIALVLVLVRGRVPVEQRRRKTAVPVVPVVVPVGGIHRAQQTEASVAV